MFDWLKSRYTKFIEAELERERKDKIASLAALQSSHEKQLEYVTKELAWHKEECERLRRFLMPTMQPVYERVRALNEPEVEPQNKEPQYQGTPFQRMVQADLAQQDAEIAARKAKEKREAEDKAKAAEKSVN